MFLILFKGLFDDCFKCGYCGFLIKSHCENLLEHECLKNIYIEGQHDLMEDENKVLTIGKKYKTSCMILQYDKLLIYGIVCNLI